MNKNTVKSYSEKGKNQARTRKEREKQVRSSLRQLKKSVQMCGSRLDFARMRVYIQPSAKHQALCF
jgi:hypothetical protein